MSNTLDIDEVHKLIDARIKHFGSSAAYAKHLDMTPQQLNHSIEHCLTPTRRVLMDIGLEKKTVYCLRKSIHNTGDK